MNPEPSEAGTQEAAVCGSAVLGSAVLDDFARLSDDRSDARMASDLAEASAGGTHVRHADLAGGSTTSSRKVMA